LKSEDYYYDFFHNVITAVEITNFFIENTALESVVNIGFEFAGMIKPYKKILSYAAAKNSLLLITRSYAENYKHIRFNMVCPATLAGAAVESTGGKQTSPVKTAQEIYETLLNSVSKSSG
jgi:NAD(P)-dependent dehydrogenase (short-subunit alcohol dehydrogenase family)